MRCIALLSGGKDSVAAVEVAQGHGWEVVAALVVRPAKDDAYMFHTPNLDLAVAMADCMGLPVVEAAARPDPVEEVSDLEQALVRAKQDFNLDAVVSGALASDYQRVRIDAIGHRVGLRTFAPLWHKEPRIYLASLLAAGYELRFSRVAADGLGAPWAGRALDEEALRDLAGLRIHIAGEGGEYETAVLDAPHFSKRLQVTASHTEATASRATWVVDDWEVQDKPAA